MSGHFSAGRQDHGTGEVTSGQEGTLLPDLQQPDSPAAGRQGARRQTPVSAAAGCIFQLFLTSLECRLSEVLGHDVRPRPRTRRPRRWPPLHLYCKSKYTALNGLDLYCDPQYNRHMPKTEVLQIRLDEREKRGFQDAADLAGIPLSSWVRERLRLAAIRDLESAGKQIPFVKPFPIRGPGA